MEKRLKELEEIGGEECAESFEGEEYDFRESMIKYYLRYYKSKRKNSEEYEKLLLSIDEKMKTPDPIERWYFYKTLEDGYSYTRFDCDNSNGTCQLAGKIYEKLWEKSSCQFCEKGDKRGTYITGETMNSIQTTLNQLFKIKGENTGSWSFAKCKALYEKDRNGFLDTIREVKGAESFFRVAYCVGNFTIWPAGCNGPRSTGLGKDYWDLTLHYIRQWYADNKMLLELLKRWPKNEKLFCLFHSPMVLFPEWLAAFESWDNFVKINYMQDFVYAIDEKSDAPDDGPFGPPREWWAGHFSGPVLPTKQKQIENYFVRAAECIQKRSGRMAAALRKSGCCPVPGGD